MPYEQHKTTVVAGSPRRLIIDITEELYARMDRALPHGTRKAVFTPLLDMVLSGIEKHGMAAAASLIDGRATISWNFPTREDKDA